MQVISPASHPADEPGKAILQRIYKLSEDPFRGRIVFLEDYDINLAPSRASVDACGSTIPPAAVSLGNERQKVVLGGVLNCSVLDGWWAEAFDGSNGFAIGTKHPRQSGDPGRRDAGLIAVLTNEIIPLFYERDQDDLPRPGSSMKRACGRWAGDSTPTAWSWTTSQDLHPPAGAELLDGCGVEMKIEDGR